MAISVARDSPFKNPVTWLSCEFVWIGKVPNDVHSVVYHVVANDFRIHVFEMETNLGMGPGDGSHGTGMRLNAE